MLLEQLGPGESTVSRCEVFEAEKAQYLVGDFYIDVMQPLAGGPLKEVLDRDGNGLFQVDLHTSDLSAAAALLGVTGAT